MKKKWTYILAFTLTAGLAACNGSNGKDNNIVFGDNQIGNGEQGLSFTHTRQLKGFTCSKAGAT